jgi:HAD superfamily hydrolase (TIGR01490 family)
VSTDDRVKPTPERRPTPRAVDGHGWPVFDAAPPAVFLDVDGTLLAHSTAMLFSRVLRRQRLLRRSAQWRGLLHGLQHAFGRLDYAKLAASGVASLGRIPVVQLERLAYENFAEHIKPRLFVGVVEHLAALRRRGTAVVLVSGSPGFVLEPLAVYLGCEGLITTPVRVERGKLVGLGEGPPCYGDGKRHWAEDWASRRGISMDATAAYADNWSDRTLLARVGHPVVVRPRGRLRRLARQHGWTEIHPRRPARSRPRSV